MCSAKLLGERGVAELKSIKENKNIGISLNHHNFLNNRDKWMLKKTK
jgi:hypothetical protein